MNVIVPIVIYILVNMNKFISENGYFISSLDKPNKICIGICEIKQTLLK